MAFTGNSQFGKLLGGQEPAKEGGKKGDPWALAWEERAP